MLKEAKIQAAEESRCPEFNELFPNQKKKAEKLLPSLSRLGHVQKDRKKGRPSPPRPLRQEEPEKYQKRSTNSPDRKCLISEIAETTGQTTVFSDYELLKICSFLIPEIREMDWPQSFLIHYCNFSDVSKFPSKIEAVAKTKPCQSFQQCFGYTKLSFKFFMSKFHVFQSEIRMCNEYLDQQRR